MTISKETEEKIRNMIDIAIERSDNPHEDQIPTDDYTEGFRQGVRAFSKSLRHTLTIDDMD